MFPAKTVVHQFRQWCSADGPVTRATVSRRLRMRRTKRTRDCSSIPCPWEAGRHNPGNPPSNMYGENSPLSLPQKACAPAIGGRAWRGRTGTGYLEKGKLIREQSWMSPAVASQSPRCGLGAPRLLPRRMFAEAPAGLHCTHVHNLELPCTR